MPFDRLAPFIQEYLYTNGLTELRQVQAEACRVIFDTDCHLLIAAGTASGKTEAAFLPILTHLHNQPTKTVGAVYIGPIKALINDQFERLTDLLQAAHIPVHPWHGDIAANRKQQVFKQPSGILQITPESLESLLINRAADLPRLFADLQFVVIDEIHAFMGTERGAQILCQLARLSRLTGCKPRRVGLSATLGDYGQAEEWLRSGTPQAVITPMIPAGQRTVRLAIEHFYIPERAIADLNHPYYRYLFDSSKSRRCLIFANDRNETETVITHLRQLAAAESLPDIYHVHHGSVAPALRQAAEAAMKHSDTPTVTAATLTLEMGVDIGHLDRVIQLEAPFSVASFLQRLGRTGRRGSAADMRFVCTEVDPGGAYGDIPLPEQIPWALLQCVAILQLYLEDRWIEPMATPKYPFSLLYQQTLSTLAGLGELSPAGLAQRVLTLPPFQAITSDQFRQLLHHLIGLEHLQQTPEGGLILGLQGERIVRNFKFYATFPDTEDYAVQDGNTLVGTIVQPPEEGQCFSLAGRTWLVLEVNRKSKTVYVQPTVGSVVVPRQGRGDSTIHTRVLQRMRQALLEDTCYPYLQPKAQQRLNRIRRTVQQEGLETDFVLPLEGNAAVVFPWMGAIAFRTLERYLTWVCKEALELRRIIAVAPYYFIVQLGKSTVEQLRYEISSIREQRLQLENLLGEEEVPQLQKYDEFIPADLLRQAFMADCLDLDQVKQCLLSSVPRAQDKPRLS